MRPYLGILLIVTQGWILNSATAGVITSEELYIQAKSYVSNDLQAIAIDEETRTLLGSGIDVNAFVQAVLRESYLIQSDILRDFADKVKNLNDLKETIRNKIRELRESQSQWQGRDFEAIPYFLYMGATPSSESTEITISGFDDDSLNSVNAFLSGAGLGNYSFVPTPVSAPAAIWLFGAGLIGLIGFSKRR